MGTEASEQVMTLLKELDLLKEQNKEYEAHPTVAGKGAHRLRQKRHEEITDEIKALAKQTTEAKQNASP